MTEMSGSINEAVYDDPEFRALSDVARLVLCYFSSFAVRTPEAMREAAPDVAYTTGLPPLLVGLAIEEIISRGGEKLLARYARDNGGGA
jgi:hypothetical protein